MIQAPDGGSRRKGPQMDDHIIQVRLETGDRNHILRQASPSPELRRMLRLGLVDGNTVVCRMTSLDVAELLDCMVTLSENAPRKEDREHFRRVLVQLTRKLNEEASGGEARTDAPGFVEPRHPWAEPPRDNGNGTMPQMAGPDVEALARLGAEPMPELCDLSLPELIALIDGGIGADSSVVLLNTDVEAAAVEGTRFLRNARTFLHAVDEMGHIKATDAGNLNRAFVSQMLDNLDLVKGYRDRIRHFCKAIRESDVHPIHVLRIVLTLAGLLSLRHGRFRVTRKGKSLMREEHLTQLYARLFLTFIDKFNLACLDCGPECPEIQDAYCYTLYAVARKLKKWVTPKAMAQRVLLPMTYKLLNPVEYEMATLLTNTRILEPLAEFGLLEVEYAYEPKVFWSEPKRVRKTPLFDRFISFSFPDTALEEE